MSIDKIGKFGVLATLGALAPGLAKKGLRMRRGRLIG